MDLGVSFGGADTKQIEAKNARKRRPTAERRMRVYVQSIWSMDGRIVLEKFVTSRRYALSCVVPLWRARLVALSFSFLSDVLAEEF